MAKGATDPNSGKVLKRDTWIGINSTNSSTINPYVLEIAYVNDNIDDYRALFKGFNKITTLEIIDLNYTGYDMETMFEGCTSLVSLDVSNLNTSNVTRMWGAFRRCPSLISLDLSSFDTSKVINMEFMFENCSSLMAIDVTNFDTSKVTSMTCMFYNCSSLTSLDLSYFDTSKVTGMWRMFYTDNNLRYITLGSNFFRTTATIPFMDAPVLGLNPNNTDNGWLSHLSSVAPEITDGQGRTIQLHNALKNKPWAQPYLAILQDKGYTIS